MAKPPKSASSFFINLFGGVCYILSAQIALFIDPDIDLFLLSIISFVAAVIPIVLCEVLILKVHRRASVGLLDKPQPDKKRLRVKLLGYYGSLGFVGLIYLIIPMYHDDPFYHASFMYMALLLFVFVVGGWLYMSEFDGRLKNPYDAYWHFGNMLLGRFEHVDRDKVQAHLKSLLLRAFFVPVMLSYILGNTALMVDGYDDFIGSYMVDGQSGQAIIVLQFFVMVYFFLAVMDVLFAVIGYLFTLRLFDTHIRSTEPTFLGWFICIICYYPFFEIVLAPLLFDALYDNPKWDVWFTGLPTALVVLWGVLVMIGIGLESLTTLTFGMRFSNLTYRGVVTEGPFRLTKHPQYIFKMMNRFCVYMPFLSVLGFFDMLLGMVAFIGVCFTYYLRAKTEENHLSRYPEYVEYAHWVEKNGVFRHIGRYIPFLAYSEEKAKQGKLF